MAKARHEETVISERFANKIRWARERAGLSQRELADLIGSRQPRICGFEQRSGNPKPFELLGMSRRLMVPLDYLLDDEIEDPNDPRIMLTLVPEPVRKALELVIRLGPELAMARMLKIDAPCPDDPPQPNPRPSAADPGKVTLWESPASQPPYVNNGPKGRKKGPGPKPGPGPDGR